MVVTAIFKTITQLDDSPIQNLQFFEQLRYQYQINKQARELFFGLEMKVKTVSCSCKLSTTQNLKKKNTLNMPPKMLKFV